MAGFTHSKESVFKIRGVDTSVVTLFNISAYVTGVEGLPGEDELSEITTLADSGRKFFGDGLQVATITLNMLWNSDPSSSGGGPNILEDVFGRYCTTEAGSTQTRAFEYSPDTTASGKRKLTGDIWIRSITERSRLGDMVMADAELQVDGQVTLAEH